MPIRTTVVGSYPVPQWLYNNSSRVALRDAVMVVLKTQELAGLDVVADGEMNRFDPSHPETNGMIDYFTTRMSGIFVLISPEMKYFSRSGASSSASVWPFLDISSRISSAGMKPLSA